MRQAETIKKHLCRASRWIAPGLWKVKINSFSVEEQNINKNTSIICALLYWEKDE